MSYHPLVGAVDTLAVINRRPAAEPARRVMQRENERARVLVDGKRTDDDTDCMLVVVHERIGDCWAFYPHGVGRFGVRLTKVAALKMAKEIIERCQ